MNQCSFTLQEQGRGEFKSFDVDIATLRVGCVGKDFLFDLIFPPTTRSYSKPLLTLYLSPWFPQQEDRLKYREPKLRGCNLQLQPT
jgi:hypothetical protein